MINENFKELKDSFMPINSNVIVQAMLHFNKDITKEFFSILLGIDVNKIDFINNKTSDINEHNPRLDLTFLVNDELYVNIEANRESIIKDRKFSLYFQTNYIIVRVTKKDDIKFIEKDTIQMNLDAIKEDIRKPERTINFFIKENDDLLTGNMMIKLYNIDRFKISYYNNKIKDKKAALITLFGTSDFNEFNNLLKIVLDEKKCELFKKKYREVCNNKKIINEVEKEKIERILYHKLLQTVHTFTEES